MRSLTVLVLITVLAGCTRPRTAAVAPDDDYQPLQISLLGPSAGFGFWVNQPAYVAVFDIVPGQQVRLAYPVVAAQLREKVSVGSSLVRRGFGGPSHLFASRRLAEPHILLAVASLRPLNISRTAGFSEWLSYKLGAPYFMGSTLGISNQVLKEVVPAQPHGDWATAMYLVYPDLEWRDHVWQLVRCPDGMIYVVNIETPVFRCPQGNQAGPARPPAVDDGRGRRREPVTVRPGAAVARALPNGQLPVLEARDHVVRRPPDPSWAWSERRYLRTGSTGTTRTTDNGRRASSGNAVGATPSAGGTSTAAARPTSLEPASPSPSPPAPRGGDKTTKADP